MANQFHLLIIGLAFGPPMRMLPSFFENSTQTHSTISTIVMS